MKRALAALVLIALLLTLPGCPETRLGGAWILSLGVRQFGVELKADGEVAQFDVPPNNYRLSGILEWTMRGEDHFILYQDEPLIVSRIWTGAVLSDTSMSGIEVNWRGGGPPLVQTWSAVKIP